VDIGPTELIIALVIILLLFGGKKLPEIARGLGRAQHEFKEGMQNPGAEPAAASTASTTPTAAPPTPATASAISPPGE
jgi:sec-independent protein translocase protein TatA